MFANDNTARVSITTAEYRELIRAKHVADCLEAFLTSDRFDDYGLGKSDLDTLRLLFTPQKENGGA